MSAAEVANELELVELALDLDDVLQRAKQLAGFGELGACRGLIARARAIVERMAELEGVAL